MTNSNFVYLQIRCVVFISSLNFIWLLETSLSTLLIKRNNILNIFWTHDFCSQYTKFIRCSVDSLKPNSCGDEQNFYILLKTIFFFIFSLFLVTSNIHILFLVLCYLPVFLLKYHRGETQLIIILRRTKIQFYFPVKKIH